MFTSQIEHACRLCGACEGLRPLSARPYGEACMKAIKHLAETNIDTVKFEDVFSIIEIFDIFNSAFISFDEKQSN